MKYLDFGHYAVISCVATALLAACGALRQAQDDMQPPIGASGVTPQNNAANGLGSGDLVFASADRNASGYYIFAWSYPRGRFAMKVGGAAGIGMCSDHAGDVWLAEDAERQLAEFDHSGLIIKTLPDESYNRAPWGCSVDPSTGNVAAVNIDDGDLVVCENASGSGTAYQTSLDMGYSCAYDDQGNLFGYGINRLYKGQLVELPKGGDTVGDISVDRRLPGDGWIQWDGKHLAVTAGAQNDHTATIDRLLVSGTTARVIGKTLLENAGRLPQFGVPQFWIQGHTILESTGYNAKVIGLWSYPRGGKPKRLIRGSGGSHAYYIDGLTVSAAAQYR
jgi:hypothetical protein